MPVPVPLPMFSWTGAGDPFVGATTLDAGGVGFFTQIKTITSSWPEKMAESGGKSQTSMPILK